MTNEYALAGVDYAKIQLFKDQMVRVIQSTAKFPNRRNVVVEERLRHSHGGVYRYVGSGSFQICQTAEGLGNKNWIAEWMYAFSNTGRTFYEWIGWDTALMAVNDLIAQGAMPVAYTDEVAAGDSDWFTDSLRTAALVEGFHKICEEVGMALVAGESPSLRYLVKSEPPVESCPSMSGCVVGIIAPANKVITGENLKKGDVILGVPSSGLHCNGVSAIIKRGLALPDKLLTKVPGGKTLGEEALIPTRSYVALVESLLNAEVDIHALIPATGDGVSKLAFDKRSLTYRIHSWPSIPPLFEFMGELGMELKDCLKIFNMGIGYYVIVPEFEVERVMELGKGAGYEVLEIGRVEEGERQVYYEPAGIPLRPPGE